MIDRLKGWSKAEGEPQARATEKEQQPGVQSYDVFIDRWCRACGEKECDYPIML